MKLKKNNLILICLIVFGIGLILSSLLLIFNEIKQAKDFCDSINGNYTNSKLTHKCNDIQIFQYNSVLLGKYWGFNPIEDYKIILPKK